MFSWSVMICQQTDSSGRERVIWSRVLPSTSRTTDEVQLWSSSIDRRRGMSKHKKRAVTRQAQTTIYKTVTRRFCPETRHNQVAPGWPHNQGSSEWTQLEFRWLHPRFKRYSWSLSCKYETSCHDRWSWKALVILSELSSFTYDVVECVSHHCTPRIPRLGPFVDRRSEARCQCYLLDSNIYWILIFSYPATLQRCTSGSTLTLYLVDNCHRRFRTLSAASIFTHVGLVLSHLQSVIRNNDMTHCLIDSKSDLDLGVPICMLFPTLIVDAQRHDCNSTLQSDASWDALLLIIKYFLTIWRCSSAFFKLGNCALPSRRQSSIDASELCV